MVKTILIGHGYFGRIYRDHLDRHPNFEVVGVCDTDYDRLRMLEGRTTSPSYDMIRHNVKHDAVVICTPPQDHADLSIKALADDKAVLCMKPGAMTLIEAELVMKTADAGNQPYIVDYTAMNAPEYADLIPGMHGTITSASSSRHVPTGPKPEGIILDLLSHDIAMFDDMFWDVNRISVSCQMLDAVTAALTISDENGERLLYVNASYNTIHPRKQVITRIKPRNNITNPLILTTWNQNQRSIKIETQGRSIELHYRHEPDPITESLTRFYESIGAYWSYTSVYTRIWKILHAAMHSAENDGILIGVDLA